jgi:CheY-like chemotaxis protein
MPGDNRKVILLVEDNPDDEVLTLFALKESNVMNQITVARDGAEALDFLSGTGKFKDRDLSVMPQLVLLDINLPKMNGMEVLQRIRSDKRTKFLPVVMLTSSREEQDKISSYELGANSYIRKPVNFEQFAEAVRQLGLYWLVLNELPGESSPQL